MDNNGNYDLNNFKIHFGKNSLNDNLKIIYWKGCQNGQVPRWKDLRYFWNKVEGTLILDIVSRDGTIYEGISDAEIKEDLRGQVLKNFDLKSFES